MLALIALQHVEYASYRARGFATTVGERRHRMKRAIEIRRSIDQDQRC